MGKYLHKFQSDHDFQLNYWGGMNEKAFTCSAGTFVYSSSSYNEEWDWYYDVYTNGSIEVWVDTYDELYPGYLGWDPVNDSDVEIETVGVSVQSTYYEPWVSLTVENDGLNYNKSRRDRLLETPLTFEILSGGVIYWNFLDGFEKNIQYKKNDGEWTTIDGENSAITVAIGDVIQFVGDNESYGYTYGAPDSNSFWGTTCKFNVYGNIMSLIHSVGFGSSENRELQPINSTSPMHQHHFGSLFRNCTGLTDASNLLLPSKTVYQNDYYEMFYGCTSLVNAPSELPATTLDTDCYYYMFCQCTNLTGIPSVLPATTLATGCYGEMFEGCTSLTTTPKLPSTALAYNCYRGMFSGCTSLTTAPDLPATTMAQQCYENMFTDCTSLTVAPELPATELANSCYQYMFKGCTNLTTAPDLPATTLARYCYNYMFAGCTNLTAAPELPAETLLNSCYRYMFSGCSSLNYIKAMFTTTPGTSYTQNWLNGVASTGTFVRNSSATWEGSITRGADTVPTGWTITTA